MFVLDLFCGAGGFACGLKPFGVQSFGIDADFDSIATLSQYSECTQSDVLALDTKDFVGADYLHASPPCISFSSAGTKDGWALVGNFKADLKNIFAGGESGLYDSGLSGLTAEPARWIRDLKPSYISMEQVPAVLPIWDVYGSILKKLGYSVWTGVLHSERFGVPQSRQRAWLIASNVKSVSQPIYTHSGYHGSDSKLDKNFKKWVSIAKALGFDRDCEYTHYAPAGVGQKSHPAKPRNIFGAPANTVTGVMNHYLYNASDFDPGEQMTTVGNKRARRITLAEGAALQSFPSWYEFYGSVASCRRQIGNAVPPLVASAVFQSLVS